MFYVDGAGALLKFDLQVLTRKIKTSENGHSRIWRTRMKKSKMENSYEFNLVQTQSDVIIVKNSQIIRLFQRHRS